VDADTLTGNAPDLIILYVSQAFDDEICACQQVRTIPGFKKTPILVVSKVKASPCAAAALDAGCDDFMNEPIVDRLLAARVRALLRRKPQTLQRDVLTINARMRVAWLGERVLNLTNIEYDLLETLCLHPGEYLPASALLQTIWHYPPDQGNEALVRNHVRNLRRKVELDPDHPRVVLCMHGRGYMVNGEVHQY
jgi:DNA-binding response OmpR family regulator